MATDDSRTSPTLLGRLRNSPADEAAWVEFVARYGPRVLAWCRHWGLQESDAQDVTQNVLLALAREMRDFEYDPAGSFRGWLRTVARRAWMRHEEWRRRPGAGTGDSAVWDRIDSEPAGDNLLQQLEEECDRELLEQAMALVKLRVQPKTWEAFRLTALEEVSGDEAARRLDMPIGSVYAAKSNVRRMIQEEMERLDHSGKG
jgi:RNA polymerase sigma-70 factor (ECF subfamily)